MIDFVERYRIADPVLLAQEEEIQRFHNRFILGDEQVSLPDTATWEKLTWCEQIPSGL
ncbi:MAG: hypothetical protein ACOC43_09680 [Desulfohalobiaceae bacterium]